MIFYGLSGVVGSIIIILRAKGISSIVFPIAISVLFIVFAIGFFDIVRLKEIIVSDLSRYSNLSNPFKIIDRLFRVFLLLGVFVIEILGLLDLEEFSVFWVIIITFSNVVLWQALLNYFSACDPLPPAKSKVREWKERFVNAVKEVFTPAPQPSPVPCE